MRRILKATLENLRSIFENLHPHKTIQRFDFAGLEGKRLLVVAHFDPDQIFDPVFLYFIEKMKTNLQAKVLVVSTCENLQREQIDLLSKEADALIIKRNYGRDFGSWREGLAAVGNLNGYDSVILANDTVYGPITSVSEIADRAESELQPAIGGMTESFEEFRHLQSYFLVFNRACVASPWFGQFWKRYYLQQDRLKTIQTGELGLNRSATKAGIQLIPMFPYQPVRDLVLKRGAKEAWRVQLAEKPLNPYHFMWRELIEDFRFPFIKVELLKANPCGIPDIGEYSSVIGDKDLANLIANHLERIQGGQRPRTL